jgi:ATPase subunit of ABC transporter with duplicated ATPase domains
MTTVVVAVVSVLGTVMGAALTAFVTARAEQRREATQSRQQVKELRVEHQRWRRERRQAAYLSFLEALGTADRANQAFFHELRAGRAPVPFDATRIAEIRLKFKEAESAALVVMLEGPGTVAEAAHNLVGQLSSLVQGVREHAEASAANGLAGGGDTVHEVGMAFIAQRRAFLGRARDALDESVEHGNHLP